MLRKLKSVSRLNLTIIVRFVLIVVVNVSERNSQERETGRLETFSDGIFAFAITLLVLGLYDPTMRGSILLGQCFMVWLFF
jgi:hypothetical protein